MSVYLHDTGHGCAATNTQRSWNQWLQCQKNMAARWPRAASSAGWTAGGRPCSLHLFNSVVRLQQCAIPPCLYCQTTAVCHPTLFVLSDHSSVPSHPVCTVRPQQCAIPPCLYCHAIAVCHPSLFCICRLQQCAKWWCQGSRWTMQPSSSGSTSSVTCRCCKGCWDAALTMSSWFYIMFAIWWHGHKEQVGMTKILALVIWNHVNLVNRQLFSVVFKER